MVDGRRFDSAVDVDVDEVVGRRIPVERMSRIVSRHPVWRQKYVRAVTTTGNRNDEFEYVR
jgi:hypothetical protein